MEAGAVGGNPTWLSFLLTWLQAMSGLDFDHITRSQPVELFEGWIRFIHEPRRSERIANRASYYWGTPSRTTSGYCWAHTFLALYHRRRKSGNERMSCMIFRTDTFDCISDEDAKAFTDKAMAECHQDQPSTPGLTRTYGWRGMLSAISRHLSLGTAGLRASGNGDDGESVRRNDPFVPSHNSQVQDFSRVSKLICARAFKELASNDVQSFEEVTVSQWEAIAAVAVSDVYSETLNFWPLWSNATFSGLSYPQEVNPEDAEVANRLLFRQDSWHQSTEEPESYFSTNAWRTYDEIYRITDETAAFNAQLIGLSFAWDDSIMRRMLPELRANRDARRGNRQNPERPTLIAKVCEGRGKGELWLGPLPILTRMKVITETVHSVQIYCFSMEPESVIIDEREAGRRIPGAFVFRCDVSNPVARTSDFEALQEFTITSLRQGDNVYVHCVTGVRRAVIVAALLSAILMDITLEAAIDIINQSRHVEFNFHTGRHWNTKYESMEGQWMDEMHQKYRGTGSQRHDIGHSSSSGRSTPDQVCDVTFDVARAAAAAEEVVTYANCALHNDPIHSNADQNRETGFDETPVQSTLPTHSNPQEVNPEVHRSTIQTPTRTMGTRERSRSN